MQGQGFNETRYVVVIEVPHRSRKKAEEVYMELKALTDRLPGASIELKEITI